MASQSDLPSSDVPAVPGAVEPWPRHSHHPRRKRRRFSRRKTKKVVRITLIVALHVILIGVLIYIWTKIAYASARTPPSKDSGVVMVCLMSGNDNLSQSYSLD
ncbi:MAG: hypothetical protein WAL85_09320 [Candidatus Korobacteraceae bacterium]